MAILRPGSMGTVLVLGLALAGCGSGSLRPASQERQPALPAATGVGVMVNLHGGTYMQVGDGFDGLEDEYAMNAFSNTFNGLVECTDQNQLPCSLEGAPPPPAPDPAQTHAAVEAQACTFFNGGILLPSSYTQVVYLSPVPYDYTYKAYEYHYDIVPLINPVIADLDDDAIIRITGELAIELVMFPHADVAMYAFRSEGLVQDLVLTVDNTPVPLAITTHQNCAGCAAGAPGSLDFSFFPNIGMSGDALQAVLFGDARSILNSDAYSLNDDGGDSGWLLQELQFQTARLNPAVGEHSVTLTGRAAGTSFQTSTTLRLLEQGCPTP